MDGLYVHIPWCVRKCPYCDFNSHEARNGFDETAYVDRLIEDFKDELSSQANGISTVYFGGGTPSLFSANSFHRLLNRAELGNVVEATMEANPGTTEHLDFTDYRQAGISRLSLGIQSFNRKHLEALGRIHGPDESHRAVVEALNAGFNSVNLDLMFGLPDQSTEQALADLRTAISYEPQHISWYELTIEPNTVFAKSPPSRTSPDHLAEMGTLGAALLQENGYVQYEVSAFAKPGSECLHNMNYWTFGDYIGIGAGAHGKRTTESGILRTAKPRMPNSYLKGTPKIESPIAENELPVEFMMNALRLTEGVDESCYSARTGQSFETIRSTIKRLREWDLFHPTRIQLSSKGCNQLNGVVAEFLPD